MLSLPVLVFDIETIPDVKAGSHLHGLTLSDPDALLALSNLRRQESDSDFPRLPLHEIVCISGLWISEGKIKLFSFCRQELSEKEILAKFLSIFDHHFPVLVSWNGNGFDLPVIIMRAMYHGLSAAGLLDQGDLDHSRRYNNYQNRYQNRHTDLMDSLAMFNNRNFQRLDDVAVIFGFPGKQGDSGYHVVDYVREQQWEKLCRYCESDVLNTWLIYLRWQLLRGHLTLDEHQYWLLETKNYLLQHAPQQQDFLQAWQHSSQQSAFDSSIF